MRLKQGNAAVVAAGSALLFWGVAPARAVSITNVTTSTVVFFDNFESGNFNSPAVGSWGVGPDVTVTNAASPGPAQGSFYAQLFRNSNTISQGNLFANLSAPQATSGDVILLRMMVYLPSATDTDARAQLLLDDGDFNSARAWARPDGAGHVDAVGPGFSVVNTGLTYATDTWQEWDLQYDIGSSTFSVTVNGHTASGFTSFTSGRVSHADLFNGSPSAGSFFLDAVPPAATGAAPEPAGMGAIGLAAIAYAGWRRMRSHTVV